MVGTPWHVERVYYPWKRKKRIKKNCIYHQGNDYCKWYGETCHGAGSCSFYVVKHVKADPQKTKSNKSGPPSGKPKKQGTAKPKRMVKKSNTYSAVTTITNAHPDKDWEKKFPKGCIIKNRRYDSAMVLNIQNGYAIVKLPNGEKAWIHLSGCKRIR